MGWLIKRLMFMHLESSFWSSFLARDQFILLTKALEVGCLHKASRNPMYLNFIQRKGNVLGSDEADYTFGWDNKHVGARILLSKSFLVHRNQGLHDFKNQADNYICSLIPEVPSSQTRCLHKASRNPMYLNFIQRNGNGLGSDEADYTFGWDNKHVGARILLSENG